MADGAAVPPKRIAVIAVHGVGDQQPLESARAIGDLLQNIDVDMSLLGNRPAPCASPPPAVEPRYNPFTERTIRINVRPVVVLPAGDSDGVDAGLRGPFFSFVSRKRQAGQKTADDEGWYRFMRGQLRCYHGDGPEETYETVRLEGTRTAHSGTPERIVHVYEAYWADLSRLKAGIFSIFTELYQLLFHLSSLGMHVIDAESLHHSHRSWTWFSWTQSNASMWLTVPIPIINLFMLGVTLIAVGLIGLRRLPPAIQMEIVVCATAAAVAAAWGVALWRARNRSVTKWMAPLVAWLAIAAIAWSWLRRTCGGPQPSGNAQCDEWLEASRVMASVWLALIAGGLVALLVRVYNERRPGANARAAGLAAILLPAGITTIVVTGGPATDRTLFFWFRMLEVLYVAVLVVWAGFFVLAIGACLAGVLAMRHVSDIDRDRAKRSRWTARLMLGLPSFSFAVITLAGLGVIEYGLAKIVDDLAYTSLVPGFDSYTVAALIKNVHDYGGSAALPVLLAAGGLAVLPAAWGLGPVAWSEVRPPDFWRSRDGDYASRQGDWLTVTYRGLRGSGQLLYITMIFIVPAVVGFLLAAHWAATLLPGVGEGGRRARAMLTNFKVLGSISAALFAWLFAARGQLKKAALGFRTVLDILLDVDNWLREHPLNSNPKARICGRYVSLLRYVCTWRDPLSPNQGYDAIVIIAHSQGAVITADLLRFLFWESSGSLTGYDEQLARLDSMPVRLFTMGCPLRDLYGLRFPRFYAWARHDDAAVMANWTANDLSVGRRSIEPNPAELGVAAWVNAYRSGDYVGRFLWRTVPCGYLWRSDLGGVPFSAPAASVSSDGTRRMELCIGAGAHTHYWDRTAPTIAMELDRLIAM